MSIKYQTLYNGYTLLEFVIVILLIGILSATVSLKLNAPVQYSVTTQADAFRRDLSHIQLLAISMDKRLKLSVISGNYSVAECTLPALSVCATTTTLTDPATGLNFSVDLTDGATFTGGANTTLDFDSLGRPQTGGNLIATSSSYTLTSSGRSVTVTVLPITGFAQTTY